MKFNFRIVLIRTLFDSNIGSVSRVMSNLGAKNLILISPRCELTYAAQQAAASGQEALRNLKIYHSQNEYYEKEYSDIRIGFTGKPGKGRDLDNPGSISDKIIRRLEEEPLSGKSELVIDLLFGAEDCGMNNEELGICNLFCSLPVFGENESYNLSHAVLAGLMLLLLEIKKREPGTIENKTNSGEVHPFESGLDTSIELKKDRSINFPETALQQGLMALGFNIEDQTENAFLLLKRVFLRGMPSANENRVLQTVFSQIARKLDEYNVYRMKQGLPYIKPRQVSDSNELDAEADQLKGTDKR